MQKDLQLKTNKMKNIESVERLTSSKKRFILAFGVPTFMLYFFFCIYPIFSSIFTSFHSWSGFSDMEYIGFENYLNILKDPVFVKSAINDFTIVFFKEIIIISLVMLFAISLTKLRLSRAETAFYRFVYYFPNILSVIVIANVWAFFFNPRIGVMNEIMKLLRLEFLIPENGWLVEHTLPVIIFIASWCGIGLYMIVLISAINNVPAEIYESSEIDGAGQWSQLVNITLPSIWSQVRFMVVSILYGSLASNMGLILPLTNGGPDNASIVMGLYVYQKGINLYRVGFANAAAVCLMIISIVISLSSNYILARREEK